MPEQGLWSHRIDVITALHQQQITKTLIGAKFRERNLFEFSEDEKQGFFFIQIKCKTLLWKTTNL